MFKANTHFGITYYDPDTFSKRGEIRVRWSTQRKMYLISLWRSCNVFSSTSSNLVSVGTIREWSDVWKFIEEVERISKKNKAFLAKVKTILENYK